jgi:hypothetical protein
MYTRYKPELIIKAVQFILNPENVTTVSWKKYSRYQQFIERFPATALSSAQVRAKFATVKRANKK